MRDEGFLDWLREEIENADEEFRSSHGVDQNSYGAGYDRGYLDALMTIRKEYIDNYRHGI